MGETPRDHGKARPSPAWRRAGPADLAALEAFLAAREAEAAGFISRIIHDGRIRMPSLAAGGNLLLVAREEGRDGLDAALLRTQTGIAFPLLPRRPGGLGGVLAPRIPGKLAGDFVSIASVVGPEADVEAFEASLALKPLVMVSYELMRISCSASGSRIPSPGPCGLELRRAGSADLDALYPLQDAYEHEEVLTAIHRFDPRGCRAGLSKALREQIVVMGSLGGVAVAKAATNAHAFSLDQIGGVFVAPPYRRRGYGEAVVLELLGRLAGEGKGAALFVKKGNEAARGLYDELGFEALGPFRADYFAG